MRLLQCFACKRIVELTSDRTPCPCGRSYGRLENGVIEIHGPARVLIPIDGVVPYEGLQWTVAPEETVHRIARPAAS